MFDCASQMGFLKFDQCNNLQYPVTRLVITITELHECLKGVTQT